MPGSASAEAVFYSVGTDTCNLMNGSPLISITGDTATLDVAQTGNVGVADEIDYGRIAYIRSVISPTQFVAFSCTQPRAGVTPRKDWCSSMPARRTTNSSSMI